MLTVLAANGLTLKNTTAFSPIYRSILNKKKQLKHSGCRYCRIEKFLSQKSSAASISLSVLDLLPFS